jgi:parvulin-like peptidyl-prolyl isomerase
VRRQLLRLKVLNQRARGRVNITEDAVRQRWQQENRRANIRARYHVQHVFFEMAAGATATQVAATRQAAAEMREGVTAATFGDAMTEHGGGDLGWLNQGDLPEELEQTVAGLQPGEISAPVQGPNGIHVFHLLERESAEEATPEYEAARQRIYREMLEQQMERQERLFVEELRRTAVVQRRL